MLPAFACKHNGLDLCLLGSTCKNITVDQNGGECVCPPGTMHDWALFRQFDCGMPESSYYVFFGMFMFSWIPLCMLLLKLIWVSKHPRATRFGQEAMVFHTGLAILATGVLAQSGYFEMAAVGTSVAAMFMLRLMAKILLMMFTFANGLYMSQVAQLKRQLFWTKNFHGVLCLTTGLIVIPFCRSPSPQLFETLQVVFILVNFLCIVILAAFAHRTTNLFLKELNQREISSDMSPNRKEILRDVKKRIQLLKRRFIIGVISVCPIGAAMCVRIVLTSVPFMWVYLFIGIFFGQALTLGVITLFPTMKSTSDKVSSASNRGHALPEPKSGNNHANELEGSMVFLQQSTLNESSDLVVHPQPQLPQKNSDPGLPTVE